MVARIAAGKPAVRAEGDCRTRARRESDMDGQRFDRISRAMAGAATRREAIGGILAVAGGITLGVAGASAAKGGNGKGHGNGNGKGHGNANGHNKVAICHALGNGEFQFKRVPKPALKGHLKHGDKACDPGAQCVEYTGCNTDGSCIATSAAEGTACTVDNTAGACNAEGQCVPNPTS
jgi:hypothetical protein